MNLRPSPLSIVVPVFNESTNIEPFYAALAPVLDRVDIPAEIIFVDDGSTDTSCDAIERLRSNDSRIRLLRLSRNFGSHAALLAGLRSASGDAAIIISADLQDPAALIPELVRHWQQGFHVVWAVREGRDDPWLKKRFAGLFYSLFRRLALPEFPKDGMDFGLFDRCVLDSLQKLPEVNHFITGMIVWLGFRQAQVPYYRQARHSGHSKWPIWKQIKVMLDAIVSFSYVPIRWISYLGLAMAGSSVIYGATLVLQRIILGIDVASFSLIIATVLFLAGVQLIVLGVLGEYIWRGADQAKGRPQYIVMEKLGWPAHVASRSAEMHQHSDQLVSQVR